MKENSKPVKLRLKIDLVLYPPRAEGLVNMVTFADDFHKLKFNPLKSPILHRLLKLDFDKSIQD